MNVDNGLRNLIYGILAGLVANLLVAIYYAGQFESRLAALERQSLAFQVALDRVNDAREKTDIHMTQMDDAQVEQGKKLTSILEFVQRIDQNVGGSDQTLPPVPSTTFSQPDRPHTGR